MKNSFKFISLYLVLITAFYSCKKEEIVVNPTQPDNSVNRTINNNTSNVVNQSMYYWADLLVQNCTAINSSYVHTTPIVTWAGQNGATTYQCHTDCSGLVNSLLTQTYGYTSTNFLTWWNVSRPLAQTYHDAIAAKNKFLRRTNISQIVQGDYIAIKYPTTETNTGHIMMVVLPPVLRASTSPLINGTKQYDVMIIDCSNSGHGSTDTRYITATGTFNQGVGRGVFRIYTNSKGVIQGYTWSTYSNSVYYNQSQRHLEVGKFVP